MKTVRALALVVALEFLIGVVGAVAVEKPASHTTARRRAPEPLARRLPSALTRVVGEVSSFVQTSRGLHFKRPVRAGLLDDAAFADALTGGETDADALAVERTLGFVDPSLDDAAAEGVFNDVSDVVGFYDVVRNRLYVRGTAITPYVRTVLAHELTHALQDQHFNLERGDAFGVDDESDLALRALAEGDAMRVENAYYESMSPDDQKAYDAVLKAHIDAERAQPQVPLEQQWPGDAGADAMGRFPYQYGPPLVARIIEQGGQQALDGAFRKPPVSSEQVMYPNKATDVPVAVADPAADGAVLGRGPMGVLAISSFLAAQWSSRFGGRSWSSDYWSGGRYVAYKAAGGNVCVRFTVTMDDGGTGAQLADSLRLVADLHGNSTVSGPRQAWKRDRQGSFVMPANAPVTYTTCGLPAARTHEQAHKIISAFNKRESDAFLAAVQQPSSSYNGYQPPPYPYQQPMYSPPSASGPMPQDTTTTTAPASCLQTGVVGLCNR